MKKLLGSVLMFVFLLPAMAQNEPAVKRVNTTRPPSFGVSFFFNDYITAQRIRNSSLSAVLRDKQWAKRRETSPGLALTYFQGMTPNIDFAGTLAGSFVSVPLTNRTSNNESFLLEADAAVNLKMFPDRYLISPYLIAGIGASRYEDEYAAFLPLGGGVKFNFFEEAAMFVTLQYRVPIIKDASQYHFMSSIGIAGNLTSRKPVELIPPPAPIDTDGDGIFDHQDSCVTIPGVLRYNGCPVPDTDNDGINDDLDSCVTVPGLARYKGCPIPDTDKDGINDEEDRCKDVPGVARYQGCPVPDADKDGVNDEEDQCPQLAGTVANKGCPEIAQEVIQRMQYAAKNIYFNTGSAKLMNKSFTPLNDVVKILNENPDLKLTIEGHTDNVGADAYNQKLSQSRANSVKQYLVSKGISASRITSTGYGETKPIADNKTAAGRAQNRRSVLTPSYQ